MNLNHLKSYTQSKYFKPILKAIILLWFFYAVYDIFFRNSSDSDDSRKTYIVKDNSENRTDTSSIDNKHSNNNDKSTITNSNTNKDNNFVLFNYTVSKGESLKSIATLFKTNVNKLKQINSLKNEQIKVGSTIKIPVKAIHTIKKGETLYSIAVKYGTTRKILKEVNKLSSETDIKVGKNICIPLL